MDNKVYILRKIHPNAWSGIRLYPFSNEDIGPAIDAQGLPITGLTEDSQKKTDKGHLETIKGTRVILEDALGLDPGTLKKGSLMKPSEFWINYCVRIGEGDLKLDESIPDNKLKIEFLKAQPQVAFGVKGIGSNSEYVLFTREDEAANSNKGKRVKREAYKLFEELTLDEKAEVLEINGVRPDSLSRDVIEDKLSDFMEEYPAKFIAIVNDPTRKNKTFIRKCLDRGIIAYDGGAVTFNEIVLGYDIDSASQKVFSEESGKTLEALKIQLKEATKSVK